MLRNPDFSRDLLSIFFYCSDRISDLEEISSKLRLALLEILICTQRRQIHSPIFYMLFFNTIFVTQKK